MERPYWGSGSGYEEDYYYTIDPSLAMSPNIPFRYRLKNREGVVADIVENSRGFYVTAEFDEPEVDMTK